LAYFYECEVFDQTALQVTWGINEGNYLHTPESAYLGDIYSLRTDATPAPLRLIMTDQTYIAPDQKRTCRACFPAVWFRHAAKCA